MGLWHEVVDIPTVETAVAYSDAIDAHTLRDGTVDALDRLDDLDADLWVESFANEQDLADDIALDYDYGGYESPTALAYWMPDACVPDAAVREFAESLVERDDIEGGALELCIEIVARPAGGRLARGRGAGDADGARRARPDRVPGDRARRAQRELRHAQRGDHAGRRRRARGARHLRAVDASPSCSTSSTRSARSR